MNYKPKHIQKALVFSHPTPFPGVPATPQYTNSQTTIIEPGIHEHLSKYARWLQINNSIPISSQNIQAYQDAALESKKVGTQTIRTFAPFQERTSALQVITKLQACRNWLLRTTPLSVQRAYATTCTSNHILPVKRTAVL